MEDKKMALRTIRIQGDPVLTKKCREINEMTKDQRTDRRYA